LSLRIAFDLDGVLADMESALIQQIEGLFGEPVARRPLEGSPAPIAEAPDAREKGADAPAEPPAADAAEIAPPVVRVQMTMKQTRRLWRHIETVENFWESLAETEPGVVARLAAIAADRRWEVIFLTKRPRSAGSSAQVQTQRWLRSKGFDLPSVYVVQGNRGRIAAALDIDFVIDDRPENCLDVVVDSQARAILVWREDEKHVPVAAKRLGIGIVTSVDECLKILTQVDGPPVSDKAGLIDRVMRLLGLKEPA
jgi:hypothetical protein